MSTLSESCLNHNHTSTLGLSHGAGVLPDNLYGEVGGSVMFTTTIHTPFVLVDWTFINDESIVTAIIMSTGTDVIVTGSGYEDRISLNTLPVSLELRNLTFNDNGEYRVSITPSGGGKLEGSANMNIYGK